VVADRAVFLGTLHSFNDGMGRRRSLPQLAGTDLDAWELYKLVCGMGGYRRVTCRRAWPDVCRTLRLPPAVADKPTMVQKFYQDALYHYEQVGGRPAAVCCRRPRVWRLPGASRACAAARITGRCGFQGGQGAC
jgi:hypothetical protein